MTEPTDTVEAARVRYTSAIEHRHVEMLHDADTTECDAIVEMFWTELEAAIREDERSKAQPELRASADWAARLGYRVLDPDGWDRQNFEQSWNEHISRGEFESRLAVSTVQRVAQPDSPLRAALEDAVMALAIFGVEDGGRPGLAEAIEHARAALDGAPYEPSVEEVERAAEAMVLADTDSAVHYTEMARAALKAAWGGGQ